MATEGKIIGIINWCLIFITMAIYILIFSMIKYDRRQIKNTSVLLTLNTCLASFLTSFTTCIMTSSNLFGGYLMKNLTFCYTWGFLYDFFECAIYYSYCVQAFYRLCRVVFYKKRSLISYSIYTKLCIGQWLFTFLLLLPTLFLYYIRLPTETYCLVPYTDIHGQIYLILALYLIPLVSIIAVYVWITTFIRESSRATTAIILAQQRQRNLRDLAIIKRIVIIISVLVVLRFPTIIFITYGLIVGELYLLTYAIVGLITSICLILIGLITIHTTPSIRKHIFTIFNIDENQVNPSVT